MLYYEFNTNDKTYKLRLNTRNIIALEKKLGQNPLTIFFPGGKINSKDETEYTLPSVEAMVSILHYSLQQYQHNISFADTEEIFDKWIEEKHTVTDFLPIVTEIFKVSGIFAEGEEKEKN